MKNFFRRIHSDPLENVSHAKGDGQVWYEGNAKHRGEAEIQHDTPPTQAVHFPSICMVDRLWTHGSLFTGYGWV